MSQEATTALAVLAGFGMLAIGGDILIRGSVSLAKVLRLSPFLIGLTVVAFGTSMPELIASVRAAQLGAPGIAVGNIMGSNIANILLILGIAALITPLSADKKGFRRDAIALTISALFFTLAIMQGEAGRAWGVTAIAMLAVYIVVAYRSGRVHGEEGLLAVEAHFAERHFQLNLAMVLDIGVVIAGLLILGFGGDLLVRSSVRVAGMMGLSETFIGLTIVALGTSAPELVVSILAAIKKQTDVALGNIIGSNLFNVLAVLGVTSVMIPISISDLAGFDIAVMLGATALLVVVASTDHKITRTEGMVLLGGYVTYLGLKFALFM